MDCTYNLTWLKSRPAQGRERFKNGFRLKSGCQENVAPAERWYYSLSGSMWAKHTFGNGKGACRVTAPNLLQAAWVHLQVREWASSAPLTDPAPSCLCENSLGSSVRKEGRSLRFALPWFPELGSSEREKRRYVPCTQVVFPPPLLIIIIFSKYLFLLWSFFFFQK